MSVLCCSQGLLLFLCFMYVFGILPRPVCSLLQDGFTWPGKRDAIRQSQTPSRATLRPAPEESVDWDTTQNLYIEGDNLEVLKLLQRAYHGKVKLIYIDPPYNTGNDFVYKDSFGDSIENYRRQAGLGAQSNPDTSGRFHSDWCSMLYPRLRLARELLKDEGIIFISIDDNELDNLRFIMDELFGATNRIAQVVTVANPGGRDYGQIAVMHEYILVYTKSAGGINMLPVEKDFAYFDTRGGYEPRELRNRNPKFNRANRPNLYYPFYADPGNVDQYGYCSVSLVKDASHQIEIFPLNAELKESCWRWGMPRAEGAINIDPSLSDVVAKRVSSGKWNVYEKSRLLMTKSKSIWSETSMRTEDGTRQINSLFPEALGIFDHPKSLDLLLRCIKLAADDDDIILDFFSGSGTVAHAVMEEASQGRRLNYILVQLPEVCKPSSIAAAQGYKTICEVAEERIRRAGAKIAAEMAQAGSQPELSADTLPPRKLDIGFRVFKLDESGISRPQDGDLIADVRKPGRSDEDIIFEMMLKWGLELTLPVKKVEAAGYPCWSVAEGELVCCLASGLTMQAIDAIADMAPRRVLLLDSILDDMLKLNAVKALRRVREKTGREVELRTV